MMLLRTVPIIQFFAAVLGGGSERHLIVFGDSLSDANNGDQTNEPVPVWKGRYSDGPVWCEYLAYFKNYTLLNYAIGGATTNNTSVYQFTNQTAPVPSVLDQISTFNDTFGHKFKADSISKDLVVVEIGANDMYYALDPLVDNDIDMVAYSSSIFDNIIEAVSKVSALGYKNIIVTTVHDIKDAPYVLEYNSSIRELVSYHTNEINKKLLSMISTSKSAINGLKLVDLDGFCKLVLGDVGLALNIKVFDKECHVISNNRLVSSCKNSNEYAFIDLCHPNTKIHSFLGSAFAETLGNSSFNLELDSAISLIIKYNLLNATSLHNFIYYPNSRETGIIKIKSFSIKEATKNAQTIIDAHNNQYFGLDQTKQYKYLNFFHLALYFVCYLMFEYLVNWYITL
ncbi:hypothetical protein BB561_005779 [Smittium simulii]|uniref:SGNH hydrolase-type esterase domain-containing protein n=1 Tax=Smittium simulii TaxID=133385 RepID=A0A2T9Y8C2_9FUNG|nr:hypothetical protein BB561_005779 [Smittium simulii]